MPTRLWEARRTGRARQSSGSTSAPESHGRTRSHAATATARLSPFRKTGVDAGDLLHVPETLRMLEVEDVVVRPVEVVGDVRDLLVDPVSRVRHDSPRRPPARLMVNR